MKKIPQNITKHELIGLELRVVAAKNKSLIGKKGTIIDETRNALVFKENVGIKKILKKGTTFQLKTEGKTLEISGDALIGRSEERIKK